MNPDPNAWCPTPGSSATKPIPGYGDVPERPAHLVGAGFESTCAASWKRFALTGVFRSLMTAHFADARQIAEPALRHLTWIPDPAAPAAPTTNISIESVYKLQLDKADKRPAIAVKPNSMKNVRVSIGDGSGTDGHGNRIFSTQWVGSHTLFAISNLHATTELLANEIANELVGFSTVLIEYLRLLNMQVVEIGAVSELEEAEDAFAVPVTVAWAYNYNWKLSKEALKLAQVSFQTHVQTNFNQ